MPRGTKIEAGTCTRDHVGTVPRSRIASLPDSQAHPFRHKCAGCAYEMGYADGLKQGEWNKDQRIKELIAKLSSAGRDALRKTR